ncbi:DEAD/DEAH box helicase [Wenyingzhuangia sp. 2_MG-2023]|uniref:DEAD/DEAH box helicase n=1 Tax=Wenyingzhuangia sp. 2_MG-2023 TaxID=3062639 RepID=UPI0026E2E290|nr:DEAD/DEAH box helicase [Wenyingzhuangia sp. 2_MG-2023]MDO6737353.1 DEAD/DEAH box helicase [Wenyingzhuangia sp. 2_MG-2023]MDO6803110.1 DEAD/DEAH box helicase [Wenyingzhuangia sp. 1_MG-2023]
MTFKDLHLDAKILKAVAEQNYTTPTPIQEKTIPLVVDGIDVIGCAQTGTGKTAAFALPILNRLIPQQNALKGNKKIKALIVSPTRELAIQIEENFKTYSTYTNLRTTSIYGGMAMDPQIDILTKGVDVLVATPGRLLDLHKRDLINLDFIQVLVLDEADMMLDMGFIDDVKKIAKLCPSQRQTLLFSATMPPKIESLANELLNEPERVSVSVISSAAKTISQELYLVPKPKKIELCLHLLRNDLRGNIIIFRRTKFGVDKLEETLLKNKYKVDTIHGDKTQAARTKALNKFKNNDVNILIATDVAARGIDIPNLDIVINFDLPNIPEGYVHRIGRTGRAGKEGRALSFCSADEKPYLKDIQQLIGKLIPVEENHPYPLDPKAKPEVHKKQGSKYKKGRKSEASKAKKKRWY